LSQIVARCCIIPTLPHILSHTVTPHDEKRDHLKPVKMSALPAARGLLAGRRLWQQEIPINFLSRPAFLLEALQQRRTLSGGADAPPGAAAPTLKAALKALFLRVHPDLFTEWPAEQAENQRSFQLLQEYLDQAKRAPDDGPAGRVPYRFRFFLRPPAVVDGEADALDPGVLCASVVRVMCVSLIAVDFGLLRIESFHAWQLQLLTCFTHSLLPAHTTPQPPPDSDTSSLSTSKQQSLSRVELTLPPPEPSPAAAGALSPSTRKALGKLLGLCGLAVDLSAGSQEEAAAKQRLLDFLPAAAEVCVHARFGAIAVWVRGMLVWGRGVLGCCLGRALQAQKLQQTDE